MHSEQALYTSKKLSYIHVPLSDLIDHELVSATKCTLP